MSKTYEALLIAEREQAAHKKGTVPSKPVLGAQIKEPKREAGQGKQLLNGLPKIRPQQEPISAEVHHDERIIPRVSRVSVGNLIGKLDSIFTGQFRKLKSAIITHNRANSLRSILVTSCMPEEGKTTVALNLSATIATGLDHSAILIDTDLQKRTLTSQLVLGNALGLSDLLEDKASMEEIIIATEIKNLTILPAGCRSANPVRLLESIRMKSLIEQLVGRYKDSYIIIDSPPIISTSEVSTLSQMVDGIILVILADKTRRDAVKRELVSIDQDKILGVVLNRSKFETSHYYKKYHKNYYGMKKD